jgi:tetratricopeptide (TPR) repeat protein
LKSFFALVILFFAAMILSHSIDAKLSGGQNIKMDLDSSLTRILGGSKEAIGGALFLKADSYFHGGEARTGQAKETNEELDKEGLIEEHHESENSDWISKVNNRVQSHAHYHLKQEEQKEMLPYFAMATKLDPHNLEAVLTTSYWLSRHLNRIDEAIGVLVTGIQNNPDSWELEYGLGELYFKYKKNYEKSREHFSAASEKAQGKELARHEYVDIYYFLAESYRNLSSLPEALKNYKLAIKGYQAGDESELKKDIEQKISQLSGGTGAS